MDFEPVAERLEGIKFTTPKSGRVLYDWVIDNEVESILEIGFHHGVSTCYLAAALHELGQGHIITLDHVTSREKEPNLPQLLDEFGLADYVTPVFAERSYTWELYKLLAAEPRPTFDFAFHDADHTWDTTALSFFLMDKMLRPGGWMLFDDYPWTIEASEGAMRGSRGKWPEEERQTPAVSEVCRLLVDEHEGYGDIVLTRGGKWAWVQKGHDDPKADAAFLLMEEAADGTSSPVAAYRDPEAARAHARGAEWNGDVGFDRDYQQVTYRLASLTVR